MNDKIIEYIRQNQDTYTREIMTEQLVKTGYSEADIEAAFKYLADESDSTSQGQGSSRRIPLAPLSSDVVDRMPSPTIWWDSTALGFLIFVIAVPAILCQITWLFEGFGNPNAIYYLIPGGGLLILGLFLPSMLKSKAPHFGTGVKYAMRTLFVVFVVLPFIAVVVIGGICLVSNIRI